jgi:hypothetical protein
MFGCPHSAENLSNRLVDLDEILYGGDAIVGDRDALIRIP